MTAPDEPADTNANAPAVAVLACNAPRCGHRGALTQIHADTILPVHCGGCGSVLHCDHQAETRTEHGGTVAAPLRHTITTCRICRTETAPRDTVALDPAEVLRQLPLSVLDLPLEPGRIT